MEIIFQSKLYNAFSAVNGKEKWKYMAVHRRSNWYVYFIAFGITLTFVLVAIFAFKWYLFPENTQTLAGVNSTGELTDDFKPTAEHNFNLIAMISDDEVDNPSLYILAEYNAVDSRLSFIPLPVGITLDTDGRTLPNIYAAQGGEGVASAIEGVAGVHCDSFVRFDRRSFIELVSSFGNVEYNISKTVVVRDGIEVETFNKGEKMFTAESVFRYVMLADFEDGESYRFNCIGDILSELVNQNYRSIDGSLLDTYYGLIADHTENNISRQKYIAHRPALLNSVEYGVSPAEYYIPYGEYTDNGGFKISDNSIISIKQKAGII